MRRANLIKLHAAAFHFAKTPNCTAPALAQMAGVTIRTVYGWSKRPEWHAALDALHFTGDRTFAREPTRDALRDTSGLVEAAFEIYKNARLDGHTPKKAVTAITKQLRISRRRINTWAARYEWEAELDEGERNFSVEPRR